MAVSNPFTDQVRLRVALLPSVAKQTCFALKGGTAINMFLRNMPRLSVDIDLAYLPIADRDASLAAIDVSLNRIRADIEQHVPDARVSSSKLRGTNTRTKLLVWRGESVVKVEVTPVLRGSVYPADEKELSEKASQEFGFARVPVLSPAKKEAGG